MPERWRNWRAKAEHDGTETMRPTRRNLFYRAARRAMALTPAATTRLAAAEGIRESRGLKEDVH